MLFRKHLSADHSDPSKRLKLQYQAMIQQGIMSVVGIVLMVMGFQEGTASTNGVVLLLCGFLLVMMGALRLYLCYRLFREESDSDAEL